MATFRYKDRPSCQTSGCYNLALVVKDYYDGWASYRKWCSPCHNKRTAKKHGLDNIAQVVAKNAGFDSSSAYLNSFHPYRKYRKDYCENVDQRLGFKCTTNIVWDGMLDVDHKNGNPTDNRPRNLQTLCSCCHKYKTNVKKDYATPGRKMLK
jgi:hypothetical protein